MAICKNRNRESGNGMGGMMGMRGSRGGMRGIRVERREWGWGWGEFGRCGEWGGNAGNQGGKARNQVGGIAGNRIFFLIYLSIYLTIGIE